MARLFSLNTFPGKDKSCIRRFIYDNMGCIKIYDHDIRITAEYSHNHIISQPLYKVINDTKILMRWSSKPRKYDPFMD